MVSFDAFCELQRVRIRHDLRVLYYQIQRARIRLENGYHLWVREHEIEDDQPWTRHQGKGYINGRRVSEED